MSTALATVGLVAGQTCVGALLAGVLFLAGSRWLRDGDRGRGPVALALGTGTVATALLLSGMAGWLRAGTFVVVVGVLCAEWRQVVVGYHRTRRAGVPWFWVVVGGIVVIPLVVLVSFPPLAFDALTYHLPFAQHFAETSSLGWIPDLRFPVFPQLQELLFGAILVLGADIATPLTQLVAILGTAWLLHAWGQALGSPRCGLWAAALWLGNPLVVWLGTNAYVDAGLALQVTAALFAFERWCEEGSSRWLVASAATVGFAAATKYLGLFFVGVLSITVARRPGRVRNLALWSAVVFAACGYWYVRNGWATGNPLFPFYGEWLGYSDWSPELARTAQASPPVAPDSTGAPLLHRCLSGLGFLLLTPWKAVFDRAAFGYQAPLSPWYWLAVPSVLLLARSVWARRWLVLIVLYSLFWLTTVRDLRFLVPVLPLTSLVAGWGIDRIIQSRRVPSWSCRWTWVLAVLMVLPGIGYAVFKSLERGPVPSTEAAREAFLTRHLEGYDALMWLARREGNPPAVYGYHLESLRYHAPGRWVGEQLGPDRYALARRAARDGGDSLARFLDSTGADLLMIKLPADRVGSVAEESRCFRSVHRGTSTRLFAIESQRPACRTDPESRSKVESTRLPLEVRE